MNHCVGDIVEFNCDGLRAIGTIKAVRDSWQNYAVEVDQVLYHLEMSVGGTLPRGILHACGGDVPSDRGWVIRDKHILGFLGNVDEMNAVDVSDSELEAILDV